MGRTAELVLGILGGLFGIFAGLLALTLGSMGSLMGMVEAELVIALGFAAILIGTLGIVGGSIVNRNNKLAGKIMLVSGVVGFIAVSGLWVIPGILLVTGGILALKNTGEKENDS